MSSFRRLERVRPLRFPLRPADPGAGGRSGQPSRTQRQGRGAMPFRPYCAGLYQLSSPFCSSAAAASGDSVPLMTLADFTQVSFSRFGVPRDRI